MPHLRTVTGLLTIAAWACDGSHLGVRPLRTGATVALGEAAGGTGPVAAAVERALDGAGPDAAVDLAGATVTARDGRLTVTVSAAAAGLVWAADPAGRLRPLTAGAADGEVAAVVLSSPSARSGWTDQLYLSDVLAAGPKLTRGGLAVVRAR